MNHKKLLALGMIALLMGIAVACQKSEPKKEAYKNVKTQPINPNGDSELALLMRDMATELESLKGQVGTGKELQFLVEDHDAILYASATEPEKVATENYEIFSKNYLSAINQLKAAPKEEQAGAYALVVQTCIACHKDMCPGPITRIQKMKLQ